MDEFKFPVGVVHQVYHEEGYIAPKGWCFLKDFINTPYDYPELVKCCQENDIEIPKEWVEPDVPRLSRKFGELPFLDNLKCYTLIKHAKD